MVLSLCEIDEYDFRGIQENILTIKKPVVLGIVKNDLFPATLRYPKLFHELLVYARLHVAIPFTTIKVDNRPLIPTIDTKSVGDSYVVAFGKYQEGDMLVGHEKFNIRHKPIVFDRGACIHSLQESKGERWVITYYNQKVQKIPTTIKLQDFEVVFREDKYMIAKRLDGCSTEYLVKKKQVKTKQLKDAPVDSRSVFKLMNEFKKKNLEYSDQDNKLREQESPESSESSESEIDPDTKGPP